ncbi:hypothetical protein [Streptomyces halstedii]|uniref:hypothetical protein n=1 Tax=Streptomyces halstedii TaxID=1944 RepID=UPI0033B6C8E8
MYGPPVAKNADRTTTFERVAVRKDIEHGQRVIAGAWRRIATGTTVGYQCVLPLPGPVTASRVHIRIQSSRAKPRLGQTTRSTGWADTQP